MTQETLDEMVKSPRRSRVWKTIIAGALATGIGLLCLGCDTGKKHSLNGSRYSPKLEKKVAKLRYEFKERCDSHGGNWQYFDIVQERKELVKKFDEVDYETWHCSTWSGASFSISNRAPPVTAQEEKLCAQYCEGVFGTGISSVHKFGYQPTLVRCSCKDEQGETLGQISGRDTIIFPLSSQR